MRLSNAELTAKFKRALLKKIREIDVLIERQTKGDVLDAAQILKIKSYDETVENMKQADGETDDVRPRRAMKGPKKSAEADSDSEDSKSEDTSDIEEDDGEDEEEEGSSSDLDEDDDIEDYRRP